MQELIPRVYAVTGLSLGRVYVFDTGNGLALIDTGVSHKLTPRLAPQLQARGWSLEDIKWVLITHAHHDHANGLAELQAHAPARTYAHKLDAPVLRGEKPIEYANPNGFPARFLQRTLPPARVDVELEGGENLDDIALGLTVVPTPGHTVGHVSYFWIMERVLFAGDVVVSLPWGVSRHVSSAIPDMKANHASMRRLLPLMVNTLCPGHGRPILNGTGWKLRLMMEKLERTARS